MKEYYRNYDPEEVDRSGDKICERRILHIVSTALSFEAMKNAILFTFDDHLIISELVRNPKMTLDDILEQNGISLEDEREMEMLNHLESILHHEDWELDANEEILCLIRWVYGYCKRFLFHKSIVFINFFLLLFHFLLIGICW